MSPTIMQKEILRTSGDPPAPYSGLHSHGQRTPFANKVCSCDVISFHETSSFVPSVSTCLATRDSKRLMELHFRIHDQRCCYVTPWGLCFFISSLGS